jgi:transposase
MSLDPNCPGCQEAAKKITKLEAKVKSLEETIERLLGRIDELERAGKRQAGPFSKGDPKPDPKRPGRKPGNDYGTQAFRVAPTEVDEVIPVRLPVCCPRCGGRVHRRRVAHQFQTDLPPVRPITRRFDVEIGECEDCGERVQPRHELQTSDALGAAAVQLGPNVLAFAAALNKVYGPSWAKVAHLVEKAFGLKAAASTYCRATLRLGDRLGPTYELLKASVAASPIVYPDETGWRVGGHRRWLWVFVAAQVTVYRIAPSRGGEVAEEILGADFAGVLGRDGWAAYRRFTLALHQSCLGHHMRRAHDILLVAKRGAARFAHGLLRVFKAALDLRDRREDLSPHGFAVARGKIAAKLDAFLGWQPTNPLNARFAKHLVRERDHLLTFLDVPGLEATNWPAEQAIRPAVIARKLSGCNRTDRGASAQERITSVARTARQQNRDVFALFARVFLAAGPLDLGLVPEPG